MNIYVNHPAQLEQLKQTLPPDFQPLSVSAQPTIVRKNQTYRHVVTYAKEEKPLDCFQSLFDTLLTLGLSCCTDIGARRTVYNIYLAEQTTKKVSDQTSKVIPTAHVAQNQSIPTVVSVKMILGGELYYAFTDIDFFNDQFICCCRESKLPQVGDNGKIRIITSPDANAWSSAALLSLEGYDLRDPKLSQTPDGRLLLNMGATLWGANGSETPNSAVSFSSDGIHWEPVQLLPYPGQWIWRVTWNNNIAYGTDYYTVGSETKLRILTSPDAIHYSELTSLKIPASPTEATLRFLPDNTMVALVRRNDGTGLIGSSPAPYKEWQWFDTQSTLGGPDFIILPDGSMWASSRQTQGSNETSILAQMSLNSYQPVVTFPSGGDTGYPGMVIRMVNGQLFGYVSYYASQTGRACVYVAIIKFA